MGNSSFKVTMGIMPDYGFDESLGMRIDGVTDGKPASKSGIQKGDIIIKLGTYKVDNVQDYTKALGHFNKGDKTTVTLKRKSDIKTINIQF
jgi:S1-C subfamily serine protease